MSLQFYMGHNVHGAITDGLRRRGVACLTALEDGRARAADEAVLARATELGRVVFTQDTDFLAIASECVKSGRSFGSVIFADQMGITIGQAINDLELFAKVLEPEEMADCIERIPLS